MHCRVSQGTAVTFEKWTYFNLSESYMLVGPIGYLKNVPGILFIILPLQTG